MNEQNVVYDDFEKSLQHDGIQIIIPEEEEKKPPGIGASGYTPRTTSPSTTNPYYLKKGRGGYNRCILIQGNSCLANCVGYSFGRVLESGGKTANDKLPTCNAEDWYQTAKRNGMQTGSTPKVGAVIVWRSGNFWNGADGCGHVGVVERVYSDNSILVSQSNYGGTRFFLTTHKPPYNIYGQTFVGFVYNPYYTGESMWKHNNTGWWYEHADGSYTANGWEKIDGKWYHFNKDGYMQTGWINTGGHWYYLDSSGAMRTGWVNTGGKWYYLDSSGAMLTGWIHDGGKWYYCDSSGAMLTGKQTVPAYFNSSGALERK